MGTIILSVLVRGFQKREDALKKYFDFKGSKPWRVLEVLSIDTQILKDSR